MVPKLTLDPDAQKRLGKNLEILGLILKLPWTIVDQDMVDELSQACPVPGEVQHMLQQGALHYITEQTLVDLYRTSTEGDKRPLESHGQHKGGEGEGLIGRVAGRCLQQQQDEGHLLVLVSHLGPNLPFLSTHLPVQPGIPFIAEAGQGELDKELVPDPVQNAMQVGL